jgi:hypothetical protein
MPSHESAVEIPAALLPFIDIEALQKVAFSNDDRPHFTVDAEAAAKIPAGR